MFIKQRVYILNTRLCLQILVCKIYIQCPNALKYGKVLDKLSYILFYKKLAIHLQYIWNVHLVMARRNGINYLLFMGSILSLKYCF